MPITKTLQSLVGNGWMLGCSFFSFFFEERVALFLSFISFSFIFLFLFYLIGLVVGLLSLENGDGAVAMPDDQSLLTIWQLTWVTTKAYRVAVHILNCEIQRTQPAVLLILLNGLFLGKEWGLKLARETGRRGTVILSISNGMLLKGVHFLGTSLCAKPVCESQNLCW